MAESQALAKSNSLQALLDKPEYRNRFAEVLGTRAAQFISSLIQVANQSQMQQKCDPKSVLAAAMTAAALDLPISPALGFAHIVPYGNKATFVIG